MAQWPRGLCARRAKVTLVKIGYGMGEQNLLSFEAPPCFVALSLGRIPIWTHPYENIDLLNQAHRPCIASTQLDIDTVLCVDRNVSRWEYVFPSGHIPIYTKSHLFIQTLPKMLFFLQILSVDETIKNAKSGGEMPMPGRGMGRPRMG
jgi:hypothetical protein